MHDGVHAEQKSRQDAARIPETLRVKSHLWRGGGIRQAKGSTGKINAELAR